MPQKYINSFLPFANRYVCRGGAGVLIFLIRTHVAGLRGGHGGDVVGGEHVGDGKEKQEYHLFTLDEITLAGKSFSSKNVAKTLLYCTGIACKADVAPRPVHCLVIADLSPGMHCRWSVFPWVWMLMTSQA